MQTFNKKQYFGLTALFCLSLLLFFTVSAASGRSSAFVQVKTKDSPTVYFLSNKLGVRKSYINAAAYLSYGNRWSDIKIISASELNDWPEARLFKAAGSAAIYFIRGGLKVAVLKPGDLARFGLAGEPVLEVGPADLAQYREASYQEIGWAAGTTDNLEISIDQADSSSANLVPGTDKNLIGVLRFRAPEKATVTSVTLNLEGVFNRTIVGDFRALDASGTDLQANMNWRQTDSQLIVNFRPALDLDAGEEKVVKILVDLGSCPNCTNQTLRLEMTDSRSVEASLPASAAWPLRGTQYKLVSNDNILGQVRVQMKSLSGLPENTSGTRQIAKLTVTEESGHEDVLIKQIYFRNGGSANRDDWENFRLLRDGQVIARLPKVDSEGQIAFNINYLKIGAGQSNDLTVEADLTDDHNSQGTYNLQIQSVSAVGATYGLNLNPQIDNISESFILN